MAYEKHKTVSSSHTIVLFYIQADSAEMIFYTHVMSLPVFTFLAFPLLSQIHKLFDEQSIIVPMVKPLYLHIEELIFRKFTVLVFLLQPFSTISISLPVMLIINVVTQYLFILLSFSNIFVVSSFLSRLTICIMKKVWKE